MRVFHSLASFFFVKLRIYKYRLLSNCKQILGTPHLYHPVLLKGEGKIEFGTNVQMGVIASPGYYSNYSYLEARRKESVIKIGNNVAINNSFTVVAFESVVIGNDVLIGNNCTIMDADAHPIAATNRNGDDFIVKPVTIKDNVFLGSQVTILKGVTIGKNAVIGYGSVVCSDIPDNVIAAGNPAKIIRNI